MSARKILLTGLPGCGKTTLLRSVLDRLNQPAGGFYTREIRVAGERQGFEMVTLSGKRRMLAHINFKSQRRIGRFGVDVAGVEEIAVPAMLEAWKAGHIVVIDEIGPMETFSDVFCRAAWNILDGPTGLFGTIVHRSTPFTDRVKALPMVHVIDVTLHNRDKLADELLDLLKN
jgi:nucleoside-triphosphatase